MKIIKKKDFKDEPKTITTLKRGGLWEENELELLTDTPIYCAERVNCPHLGEKYIVRNKRSDGSHYDNIYANCPRVIVAKNEGGCNTTGVCIDCLLEQI